MMEHHIAKVTEAVWVHVAKKKGIAGNQNPKKIFGKSRKKTDKMSLYDMIKITL